MTLNNQIRAAKYRRLAIAEPDKAKADRLHKLAEEAERGVLSTADWISNSQPVTPPGRTIPKPLGH